MIFNLTESVFIQDRAEKGEPVQFPWEGTGGAASERAANPGKLSHAVNFYRVSGSAGCVQTLTAASMMRAAAAGNGVSLIAVTMEGEDDAAPASFAKARPLRREVEALKTFRVQRPLPLLFDILESATEASSPEGYLIFTNSDICLNERFYLEVQSLLRRGVDALIINRRTVGTVESYGPNPELAAAEPGAPHPGFDCFVFPVSWVENFVRGDSCVGIGWVMRPLLYNLVARARRLLIMKDVRLTYHYGDDAPWRDQRFSDYLEFNLGEARRVYQTLLGRSADGRKRLEDFARMNQEPVVEGPAPRKPAAWFEFLNRIRNRLT